MMNLLCSFQPEELSFWTEHFDALVSVGVTVLGFVITYFATRSNLKNEIQKNKVNQNIEKMKDLPFEICELMNKSTNGKTPMPEDYAAMFSKIIAYGSKNAVAIAVKMQQSIYMANQEGENAGKFLLAAFSLLVTQIKFDLSSEIISPESWLKIKINDYYKMEDEVKSMINNIVDELELLPEFRV